MTFRIPGFIAYITCSVLFTNNAMGQTRVGDWEFPVEMGGAEIEGRAALSPAQSDTAVEPTPNLVIRQMKPGSPLELLITATHAEEKDKCTYKDWSILIDSTSVPVLGYTFEPVKTELKTKLGSPRDELWRLFKKGLKLVVQVEQKCDSTAGKPKLANYTFSLRGSSADYQFVLGSVE